MEQAESEYEKDGEKKRLFDDIQYAARSWKYERRIIIKAEHSFRGKNPRFIVTSLDGDSKELYELVLTHTSKRFTPYHADWVQPDYKVLQKNKVLKP